MILRVAGFVLVGLALGAAFPPLQLPFVLPFALVGLLLLLNGVTMKQAFYLGFACGMAWFGSGLFWLTALFSQGAITLWAIAAVYPALFCALFVWLRERLPKIPLPLLAATVWTGIETFRSELTWPNFGFFGLGYAVVDAPILASFAAVFGSYGLSFLIVLCAALLVSRPRPAFWVMFLVVWGMLLALPKTPPTAERPLKVHLVQAMSEDDEALFRLSQDSAQVGNDVDVIMWPEYSFVSDPRRDKHLWERLRNVAISHRCYFLFGAKQEDDLRDPAKFRNTAFLLDRTGTLVGTHVKNHPIHFVRDGTPGKEAKAFPTELGRLGIAICFDLDFPDVTRRLVQDGAEVILAPSDNPTEWGPIQHAQQRQMIRMRAIECGRWIATADVAGLPPENLRKLWPGMTSVIAPTGHIIERAASTEETALPGLITRIGRLTGHTLYMRGGWRFGQLCLFLTSLLCLLALALPHTFSGRARDFVILDKN